MFSKKDKKLEKHIISMYNGIESLKPFLNISILSGQIYFISENYTSIFSNKIELNSLELPNLVLPLIKNEISFKNGIDLKLSTNSFRGIIPLDKKTSTYLEDIPLDLKVLKGVSVGQNIDGYNVSYLLYYK